MSTALTTVLARAESDLVRKKKLQDSYEKMVEEYNSNVVHLRNLTEAQQLLSAVSEKNTMDTLDFITGVINRTLAEMFPSDTRTISLEKILYAGKHPHVNVQLVDGAGNKRDLVVQSGTGLRQVVSFLYTVCLIQMTGGRKLLISDEILSGLHPEAKKVINTVLEVLAEDMQFIMVEYGLNDVGKIYNVEKRGKVARVVEVDGDYVNQVFTDDNQSAN